MSIDGVTLKPSQSDSLPQPDAQAPTGPDDIAIEQFEQRLVQMAHAKVAGEIHAVYQEWKALEASPQAKRAIAKAILAKINAAGRTKKSADKGWYQDLQAGAETE
jgi:hypothetical protein